MSMTSEMIKYYQSGIVIDADACGDVNEDYYVYEVVVVGYNTSGPIPYFIIRNSWGRSWGQNGYAYVEMQDGRGVCGL